MAIQASVISHLNWFSAQVVCDTIHRTPAVYHINTYDKVEMIQSNLVSSNDLPPQERSCGHPIRQKDLQPNFSIQISLFLARRFKKKKKKRFVIQSVRDVSLPLHWTSSIKMGKPGPKVECDRAWLAPRVNPSCLQITLASLRPNWSSQTAPQCPKTKSSNQKQEWIND